MRHLLALWGLSALAGCGVDAESWPTEAARSTCRFSLRCAAANFYYTYDNLGDCREQNEEVLSDEAEAAEEESCTFDDEQARECLRALDQSCRDVGADFETVFEPCQQVWDCGGGPSPAPSGDTGT